MGVGDVEDGLYCLLRGELQEGFIIQMCVDVVYFSTSESWVGTFFFVNRLVLIFLCRC